eukprot:TRINITY_DN5408_c0_g1_i3.p1 TRINITY_DN5408_c0_g1~~TRINITY_DN5408_c0_g1_i3.p1  ORF type:complete len:214 (+),score=22.84 TRINITY_DN5408_c0_g1_i3:78-719(+)
MCIRDRSQSESQTKKAHTYCFNVHDNSSYMYSLTDTPGFNEEMDKNEEYECEQEIMREVAKRGYFNAIVWVIKNQTRVTGSSKNAAHQIKQLLTKTSTACLIFALTRATGVDEATRKAIYETYGFEGAPIYAFQFENLFSTLESKQKWRNLYYENNSLNLAELIENAKVRAHRDLSSSSKNLKDKEMFDKVHEFLSSKYMCINFCDFPLQNLV